MDKLSIGPTPAEEDCEQLGPNYNPAKAREECRKFITLIRECFGEEPEGASLVVTSNPHDFGTYYEVAVKYDESKPDAVKYAYSVESESPQKWTDRRKRNWRGDGTGELDLPLPTSKMLTVRNLGAWQIYCNCSLSSNLFAVRRYDDGIYLECPRCDQQYRIGNAIEQIQKDGE